MKHNIFVTLSFFVVTNIGQVLGVGTNDCGGGEKHAVNAFVPTAVQLKMRKAEFENLGLKAKAFGNHSDRKTRVQAKDVVKKPETYFERDVLTDGSIVARSYMFEEDECSCITVGMQVPVQVYNEILHEIIGEHKNRFKPCVAERKIKKDPVMVDQQRPCLIWMLEDREVILDWTPIKDLGKSGKYGLIQLVVMEKVAAKNKKIDKLFSEVKDNDELFVSAEP